MLHDIIIIINKNEFHNKPNNFNLYIFNPPPPTLIISVTFPGTNGQLFKVQTSSLSTLDVKQSWNGTSVTIVTENNVIIVTRYHIRDFLFLRSSDQERARSTM